MKKARFFLIGGFAALSITIFLFVINVLMLGSVIGKTPTEVKELAEQPGLIGYFAGHLQVYGFLIVTPFFLFIPLTVFLLVFGGITRHKAIKRAEEEKPYIHGIDK